MVRRDSVDLTLSRVMLNEGQPVGVALIARRGWTSRLAAMAIIPEARGRSIAKACMTQLLDEAQARGDRTMTLEVIEQNTPAVRLYEQFGFQIIRRLVGHSGQPQAQPCDVRLETVDVREAARVLIAHNSPDLPWQLSGETLAQAGPPNIGYRSPTSFIVLTDPGAPTITVQALVTLPDARQQGNAAGLLRAAIARHPERTWRTSAIWPEAMSGVFEQAGLRRDALTQWQMTRALSSTS
jgi:GNAT superfamily N-acetyltransferase